MNLDEHIDDILLAYRTDHKSNLPAARSAVKRIILEVLEYVKPTRIENTTGKFDERKDGVNLAVRAMEVKIKELGL